LNSSRRSILLAAAIIGIPVLLLFIYNYSSLTLNFGERILKKVDPNAALELPVNTDSITNLEKELSSSAKEEIIRAVLREDYAFPSDTSKKAATARPNMPLSAEKEEHISQRILLLGDSETGGLIYPLNDYCVANGHKLEAVYTWFSASILNFGYSNKVDELMEKYKPTFVIFVVGLNEMYVTDMDRRTEAAR
jgi:hypothetical protein